jgi:hypothetical protein
MGLQRYFQLNLGATAMLMPAMAPAKRCIPAPPGGSSRVRKMPVPVHINVGGVPFAAKRDILLSMDGTLLCALFGPKPTMDIYKDDGARGCKGYFPITRNGKYFYDIVNYLREGMIPHYEGQERLELINECDYFEIDPLGDQFRYDGSSLAPDFPTCTERTAASLADGMYIMTKVVKYLKKGGYEFSGCDFRFLPPMRLDFSGCNLSGVNFEGALLRGANFRNANCTGAIFDGADLQEVNFEMANLKGSSFVGADLRNSCLEYCVARGADFTKANCRSAMLISGNFRGANFTHGSLKLCQVSGWCVDGADFTGINRREYITD